MSRVGGKSILRAAFSKAESSREDRLTEILAVVLWHCPVFRGRFLELFDLRKPDKASWEVQTQKRFGADAGEEVSSFFRPDLLFGSFESEHPGDSEGLALEVKLNAGLTPSELRRWPSMPDNETEGLRPFRRGALVPFGYGNTDCLEGTCEVEGCGCGGVLSESERERRAFRCRTWSDLDQEIAGLLGGDVIEEVERRYLYELECFMTDEPKTNVSGDRGLRSDDLDRLPGAKIHVDRADRLFEALKHGLEEAGIRTTKSGGEDRLVKAWWEAMDDGDWARTMHLNQLDRVVISRDGSPDLELSEPAWWELALVADGSKLLSHGLEDGPTLVLMLSCRPAIEDFSGLRVEDLESGGGVTWLGPVVLERCLRILTSERLKDVLSLDPEDTDESELLDSQVRAIAAWTEGRMQDLQKRPWIKIG